MVVLRGEGEEELEDLKEGARLIGEVRGQPLPRVWGYLVKSFFFDAMLFYMLYISKLCFYFLINNKSIFYPLGIWCAGGKISVHEGREHLTTSYSAEMTTSHSLIFDTKDIKKLVYSNAKYRH